MRYSVSVNGKPFDVEIGTARNGWRCRVNGHGVPIDFVALTNGSVSLLVKGKSFDIRRVADGNIFVGARRYDVIVEDSRSWQGRKRREGMQEGPQRLTASMPGKIVRLLAREGDQIQAGQGIVVVEAMKMQNEIKSPRPGRLQKITVREGANVNPGEVLAIVE